MTLRWLCWLSVCLTWFWVLMLLSHELGHVLLAWLTGGVVTEGNLWPGALAYTLIAPNPSPHWVAWGGVIVGCAAPVLLWFALKISGRDVAVLRGFGRLVEGTDDELRGRNWHSRFVERAQQRSQE